MRVGARAPDGTEVGLEAFYTRLFAFPIPPQSVGHEERATMLPFDLDEAMGGADEAVLPTYHGERGGEGDAANVQLERAGETEGEEDQLSRVDVYRGQEEGHAERALEATVTARETEDHAERATVPLGRLSEAEGGANRFSVVNLNHEREGHAEQAHRVEARLASVEEGHATTQHFFQHESTDGSNDVTQVPRSGRTDWTNIANAAGEPDGLLATISGSLAGARAGELVFAYPDFAASALSTFTIRTVRLHFYVRQTGTVANNGTFELEVTDNGVRTKLETITSNVNNLTTPRTFDVTSILSTWTKLDTAGVRVPFIVGGGNPIVADVDAVVLEIVADRTV